MPDCIDMVYQASSRSSRLYIWQQSVFLFIYLSRVDLILSFLLAFRSYLYLLLASGFIVVSTLFPLLGRNHYSKSTGVVLHSMATIRDSQLLSFLLELTTV